MQSAGMCSDTMLCFAEALLKMSRHLSALQFKECPSHNKLQTWLSELTPADVTRPLRPPAGKKGLSAAPPGASPRSVFDISCPFAALPPRCIVNVNPGFWHCHSKYRPNLPRASSAVTQDMQGSDFGIHAVCASDMACTD